MGTQNPKRVKGYHWGQGFELNAVKAQGSEWDPSSSLLEGIYRDIWDLGFRVQVPNSFGTWVWGDSNSRTGLG